MSNDRIYQTLREAVKKILLCGCTNVLKYDSLSNRCTQPQQTNYPTGWCAQYITELWEGHISTLSWRERNQVTFSITQSIRSSQVDCEDIESKYLSTIIFLSGGKSSVFVVVMLPVIKIVASRPHYFHSRSHTQSLQPVHDLLHNNTTYFWQAGPNQEGERERKKPRRNIYLALLWKWIY